MKVLGILLVAIPLSCLAAIVRGPENYVGEVGVNIKLECRANNPDRGIWWTNNKMKLVYTPSGIKDPEKYDIDRQGDRYDLIIKDPNLEDGGVYQCFDDSDENQADVVVVTEPSYSSSPERIIEKKNVTHTCESLIAGPENLDKYNIKMELKLGDRTVHTESKIEKLDRVTNNQHRIKLVYSRNAQYNEKDVKCILSSFNPDFKSVTNATLDMKYGPRDINIQPIFSKNEYYIGDVINCTADANPSADIKWKSLIDGKPNAVGMDLVLTRQHVGSNKYECVAENQPDNKIESIKKTIEFLVLDRTRPIRDSSSTITTNFFLLSLCLCFAKKLFF